MFKDRNIDIAIDNSVADPDPKDLNHFAGSRSKIIVSNPEPDLKHIFKFFFWFIQKEEIKLK